MNKANKKAGRPAVVFNETMIKKAELLASKGLSKTQIGSMLGMSFDTLHKNMKNNPDLSDAIKRGQAAGISQISNSLFNSAQDGNVTAQIFYLKNRAPNEWADRVEQTFSVDLKKVIDDAKLRLVDDQKATIIDATPEKLNIKSISANNQIPKKGNDPINAEEKAINSK